MHDSPLALQLKDYRLTTANILYRLPDHPGLLQSYLWQDYDLAPRFPELQKFLAFWEENLDGPLYSVEVASQKLVQAPDSRFVPVCLTLQ